MTYYKCGSVYTTQNSNVVVDTASGAIANFETPLAMPLLKTRFDFKATQDLHGQSGAYPAGGSAQKWDEETELGSFDTETGEKTPNNNLLRSVTPIPVSPNTTYLRRMNESLGCRIFQYDSNMDFISQDVSSERLLIFTTANNCAFINIAFQKSATGVGINYPATDTAYHPYSNICPIEGVSEINGVHCHKNLYVYDESKVSTGETTLSNIRAFYPLGFKGVTSLTFSASLKSGSSISQSDYLNIGRLRKSDGLLEILSAFITPSGITTRTLSISSDDEVVLMSLENPTVIKSILSRYDIQIEVGSQATTYEPYNGSTTLINLGGTYYGGYVTQDKDGKRELVVTHKITDLGEQTWSYSVWGAGYVFSSNLSEVKEQAASGEKGDIICSIYNNITASEMYNSNPNYSMCLNRTLVRIANSDYSDKDAFKTAMDGVKLVYELAEPFTVALPDGQPIKSLPGVNNIYADTGDTSLQFRKIG